MRSLIRRAVVAGVAWWRAGLVTFLPRPGRSQLPPMAPIGSGDSVAFGYVPPQAVPPPNYRSAHSSPVTRRTALARASGRGTLSCLARPRTVCSWLRVSNGCENSPGSPTATAPCTRCTQYQYPDAVRPEVSAAYSHTQLVTIDIGANDVPVPGNHGRPLRERGRASTRAAADQANLTDIYTQIRDVAHYQGSWSR
jgi:hypothetical protein